MLKLPPLSLYIHIPWCVRKCPYCDFNSHEPKQSSLPEDAYLKALEEDLTESLPYVQGRKLESIFFGGGTPSIVSSEMIASCVELADRLVGIEAKTEITLEANPGTFEQQKFSGFRQAGINRLSIGIQSFQEKHLSALGRIHSSNEAKSAMEIATAAGFDNINLDLMHGLPEQTTDEALADIQQAIDLEPAHLSWYELTIEPNTAFYSKPPRLPKESMLAEINANGLALLAEAGYERYEISAYARDERYSRHNLNYWQFGDYIGIGAGAHEKFTVIEDQQIVRRNKTRLPEHFINRIGSRLASENLLTREDLNFEFCMNALRIIQGVATPIYADRTGLDINNLRKQLQSLIDKKLVDPIDTQIAATPLGHNYLNSILEELVPDRTIQIDKTNQLSNQ